jgi:hypothetical protein
VEQAPEVIRDLVVPRSAAGRLLMPAAWCYSFRWHGRPKALDRLVFCAYYDRARDVVKDARRSSLRVVRAGERLAEQRTARVQWMKVESSSNGAGARTRAVGSSWRPASSHELPLRLS